MKRSERKSIVGWFNACRTENHSHCQGEYIDNKTDVVFCKCPCHDALALTIDKSNSAAVPFSLVLFEVVTAGATRISANALFDDEIIVVSEMTQRRVCAVCCESMQYIGYYRKNAKGEKNSRIDFAACPRSGCEYWEDLSSDETFVKNLL